MKLSLHVNLLAFLAYGFLFFSAQRILTVFCGSQINLIKLLRVYQAQRPSFCKIKSFLNSFLADKPLDFTCENPNPTSDIGLQICGKVLDDEIIKYIEL